MSDYAPDQFHRIRIELPDIDGRLRGKVVPAAKALNPRGHGISDILYCFTLVDEVFEGPLCNPSTGYPDVVVMPDAATLRPVPWEPSTGAVLADVLTKEGDPYPLCPREAVRRSERRLAALGLEARIAVEFEIFLFVAVPELMAKHDYASLPPVSGQPNAFSLQRWPDMSEFIDAVFEQLGPYGASVGLVHTELGFGAIEVALEPAPPLEAADRTARFKLGFKELAARHRLAATFMAKWKAEEAGSSGHIHQSVWNKGESAFWAGNGAITPQCESFLEGLLATAGDLSAIFCPNANSYRRPNPELWAPIAATWGFDNRTACCRVRAENSETCRIEHRRPGADLSVYLSIAGCIGGGALGIARELTLRPETPRDSGKDPSPELLPSTLQDATNQLRASASAREIFGELLVEHYCASREEELRQVEARLATVPQWELERYFESV